MARSASGTADGIPFRRAARRGCARGDMAVARLSQAGKLLQAVGEDRRARRDVLRDKGEQGGRFEVGDDRHAGAPGPRPTPLDGDGHQRRCPPFQLPAPPQARLRTAHPRVIKFDLTVQGLARRVDHGAPQLVQEQPRGFIPTDGKLALEQERRHAAFVGRHQIRRPKPERQRRFRPVEHGAGRQRHLVVAPRALPTVPSAQRKGARLTAARTSKPVRPPAGLQILPARCLVGELELELAQAGRKRRTGHGVHYPWGSPESTG